LLTIAPSSSGGDQSDGTVACVDLGKNQLIGVNDTAQSDVATETLPRLTTPLPQSLIVTS
jgi:hypothetical protein